MNFQQVDVNEDGYYCDCVDLTKKNPSIAKRINPDSRQGFRLVEVDKEKACTLCGYVALWINKCDNKGVKK